MPVKIENGDQALRLLRAARDEKGKDYTYISRDDAASGASCNYFEGGVPGCIVGHVLERLGLDPNERDDTEGNSASSLVNEHVIEAPPVVAFILDAAQKIQDAGGTWGDAVLAAEHANLAFRAGAEEARRNYYTA